MAYIDIENLYKNQDILLFKECYALEKLHGTSAHIMHKSGEVLFFSGGEKHDRFVTLFNKDALLTLFQKLFVLAPDESVVVYGEAYGGKQQGMSHTYGPNLKFCVFDVKVGRGWLSVTQAETVALDLGLDFVSYTRIPTDLESINAQRDADSVQAVKNGMGSGKMREGVVLRPLMELTKNNGERVIAKHKRDEFSEHAHPPKVVDPAKMEILTNARAIADQWCTEMRLSHVLQEHSECNNMEHTQEVIKAMIANIYKEGKGEIVESKDVSTAIGRKTVELWKKRIQIIGPIK